MKRILKYLFFIVMVSMVMFLYSFSVYRNQSKIVENITVEFNAGRNSFLTHKLVSKLLIQNGASVENQAKSVLDLHELENIVLSNSYIEDATVFLAPEGVMHAQVTQREPLARIVTDESFYYIDRYGIKIPTSENFSARVPLVFGVNSSNIKEVTKMVTIFYDDEFLKKEIISIEIEDSNEYHLRVRSGNYKITFGKFENVYKKIKKIKAFYNKALVDNTIRNYEIINVKYRNQVVCTKNNQDGEQ